MRPVTDSRERWFVCDDCRRTQDALGGPEIREELSVEFKRVLTYSKHGCLHCGGFGVRTKGRGLSAEIVLCDCTLRSVFDSLFETYCRSHIINGGAGEITARHSRNGITFSRRNQEFIADVELVAKRITRGLDGIYGSFSTALYQTIWKEFFQAGKPWKDVAKKLWISLDGNGKFRFFDAVNRVKEHIAREAIMLKPHALFPVEYY